MPEVDAIRFWIGNEDNRISSVWRFWDKRGQVYATAYSFAGKLKLSVHTPEINHFGLSQDSPFNFQSDNQNRFVRWKREKADKGKVVPIAFFQFPTDLLRNTMEIPEKVKCKPHVCFPPAEPGRCVEFLLASIKKPDDKNTLNAKGPYKLLGHLDLGTDELCLLLGRHTDFDAQFFKSLGELRIPDRLQGEQLRNTEIGGSIDDLSMTSWSAPLDYQAIRIAEASGFSLTKKA